MDSHWPFFCLSTLLIAIWHGILQALSIATCIVLSEFPQLSISSFNLEKLSPLYSSLEHGMFFVQVEVWQEVGRRYILYIMNVP